jgi:hypothetical protein
MTLVIIGIYTVYSLNNLQEGEFIIFILQIRK